MMSHEIPCVYEGVEYPSIKAASEEAGVNYFTFRHWIHKGVYGDSRIQPCTWNGITYPSVRAAAAANFICPESMHYRLARGYQGDADMLHLKGRKKK
jgi:hypothetical protein